jgi:hypothetical protein
VRKIRIRKLRNQAIHPFKRSTGTLHTFFASTFGSGATGAGAGAATGAFTTGVGAAPITTPVAKERAMLSSSRARLYSGTAVIVNSVKAELMIRNYLYQRQLILFSSVCGSRGMIEDNPEIRNLDGI